MTRALLRLRELILSGEFKPGDRMSELPLVERLGVSRTPLRLALAALEHEGLLRGLPAGGYVVREFTRADIRDAIELRGVLEGTAARFAAERGASRRDLRALRTINEAIEPLVHRADYESFERYVALNEAFHARLMKMAGSPMLERTLEGVLSLPFASPSAFVLQHAQLPESREILVVAHRHHLGLVDAIAQREGARAEAIAREHARLALTNLEIVLTPSGPARGGSGRVAARAGARELTPERDRAGQPGASAPFSHGSTSYCAPLERDLRRPDDLLGPRPVGVLERRADRHRRERRADALDRRLEVVERGGLELGGELGAEAAGGHRLVRDDGAAGAPHRLRERVEVERHERARVDHLGLDPVLAREPVGRLERLADHPRERDDRDVAPGAHACARARSGSARADRGPPRGGSRATCSRRTRPGSGSAIALCSSPAASAAPLGITTFSPGTCVSQASRLCECWAPLRWPAPPCVRSTSGTDSWPPDMKCAFAAWLTSWSSASVMKSMNMISTTGRSPDCAAPIATPQTAPSLIGVLRTRSRRTPRRAPRWPGTGRPRRRPRRARSRARPRASRGPACG